MPSMLDIGTDVALIALALSYGYAAYSAIAISRTLSDRIYHSQALGMGVVTIIFAILIGGTTIGLPANSGPMAVAGFLTYYATFIGFYYWIDASIRAARLTDPLFRDTFHWTLLRIVFWVYDIGALIFFVVAGTLGIFSLANAPPEVQLFVLGPLVIMIFSGVVVLPAGARRSKDRVLKRHLNWFAIYAVVVLGFVFIYGDFTPGVTNLETIIVAAAGGYLLYRSAVSLVPLYSFKKEANQKDSGAQ
jgi:hypothetical protein